MPNNTCRLKRRGDVRECGRCGYQVGLDDDPPRCLTLKEYGVKRLEEIKRGLHDTNTRSAPGPSSGRGG